MQAQNVLIHLVLHFASLISRLVSADMYMCFALNLLRRLAVKTLVDKSSLGIIDDGCPELENFITILEHIFNHRLKRETAVISVQFVFALVILLKVDSCSVFIQH